MLEETPTGTKQPQMIQKQTPDPNLYFQPKKTEIRDITGTLLKLKYPCYYYYISIWYTSIYSTTLISFPCALHAS